MTNDPLAGALARGSRRLALQRALAPAGWTLLAAVVTLELALALGAGLPSRLLASAGVLLVVAAASLLALAPRPAPAVVAAVLDARLGSGAALQSAAEALAGRHGRFAPLLLAAARARLDAAGLAESLPVRAPAGLLVGAAAATLLPFLLAAPGSGAGPGRVAVAPLLGSPEGGGAGAPPAPSADGGGTLVVAPAPPGADPPHTLAVDPLAALPPEAARALRARLEALAAGAEAAAGADATSPATGEDAAGDLARALARGDAAAAERALERLAATAGAGDRAAAARLADLAARARGAREPGGAGAGDPGPPPPGAPGAPLLLPPAVGRGERLPWLLAEATRRYFEDARGGPSGAPDGR